MTTEKTIRNPVLRGFNPDPSILRVGDDYYIATSTFQWFPGVRIHHSRDLRHWRLLTHALTRSSQLDLVGDADSRGVFAPCLSYDKGTFHLVYTNCRHLDARYYDGHNYLVTAPAVTGPWSEPVYLNSSGFDPSLFHDDDGRKWLVNMLWDSRVGRSIFGGIVLQEYSEKERCLVGPRRVIFKGTDLGCAEGPHLYKRNGKYYLMTAEGGTGYGHAVTLARADRIEGPYEVDPENPILTSAPDPGLELQKAGHASLVETASGEWYIAHLCARPLGPDRRCILGRETALQKVRWTSDGWLRLSPAGRYPRVEVPAPDLPDSPFEPAPSRDDFDAPELNSHLNTLRVPPDPSWLSLTERPGFLRLRGRESLRSLHRQSLVARRIESFVFDAAVGLDFRPRHFQQMAGLVCYYDTRNYLYLRTTCHESGRRTLGIVVSDRGEPSEPLPKEIDVEDWPLCHLGVRVEYRSLQFRCSADGRDWISVGPVFDATRLSDEYPGGFAFTGAFVGISVQDLGGEGHHADFDYFEYREREHDRRIVDEDFIGIVESTPEA